MKKFALGFVLGMLFVLPLFTLASSNLADKLSGKILIQVEENGEAWYVNPMNKERYYLGRPEDAFNVMRSLGLGISNKNLSEIKIAQESRSIAEQEESLDAINYNGTANFLSEIIKAPNGDIKVSYNLNLNKNAIIGLGTIGISLINKDGEYICGKPEVVKSPVVGFYTCEVGEDFYLSIRADEALDWSVKIEKN